MDPHRDEKRDRSSFSPRWLVVALAAITGVLTSYLLFACARDWERRSVQSAVSQVAVERVELLRTSVSQSMEVLHATSALYAMRQQVARPEFAAFVQDALRRQPELQALGWTPRVLQDQRPAFEARARADGIADFSFIDWNARGEPICSAARAEYFPIFYIEPMASNRRALGFDLGSNAVRLATLQKARDTGTAIATPPIHLIQDNTDHLGFVVYLPLFAGESATPAQRQSNLSGFVSAVFRIDNLVQRSTANLADQGLSLQILDQSSGNSLIFDAHGSLAGADSTDPTLRGEAQLAVAGQVWMLTVRPTATFVAAHSTAQPWTILIIGLLMTLALCGYLYSALRRTQEIKRRVRERTAELSWEVAERKIAEEQARLAEVKYRSIFENSVEGIFQTTPEGKYISANRALTRIYGYDTPEQLIADLSNIAHQLYVDSSRREDFIREFQEQDAVRQFESQVYRKDGQIIWISENARAVRDADGKVLYYEGTVIDISRRKRAEENLRQAHLELEERVRSRTMELAQSNESLQKEISVRKVAEDAAESANRAKSVFLARMSHEIRTPMNAVLGYAQILHRDPQLRPSQREALQTILNSGNHLIELIDDVLDLAKIEAGRAEFMRGTFDLIGLLHDVTAMFQQRCQQKAVQLDCQTAFGGAARVCGDERKLRQVLINLLGNAVKFTEHGSITLRVSAEPDDAYRFEVSDTGIGIPPELRSEIFEPFRQGAAGLMRGSAGLGLAIAQQHIDLMGGELCLDASFDCGSRFHFMLHLPAEPDESAARAEGESQIESLAPGESVLALVVDDVRENRAVLADVLRQIGCEVVTVASGREAIDSLSRAKPDIVFVDILMPELDGIETALQMRRALEDGAVKFVATSAAALPHEQQSFLAGGFDDAIAKPIRCRRVYQTLANLLGVKFSYSQVAVDKPVAMQPIGPIGLSDAMIAQLRKSAQVYSVTELKETLSEIERDTQLHAAAEFLRECIRRYDMESIARWLQNVRNEVVGAVGE